jgi:hypothetical protein
MYLETARATTRYWGIADDETGADALQCCAAAAAQLEAMGVKWTAADVVEAYAARRSKGAQQVRSEMAALCQRHELPSVWVALRFMALEAARLEAEAAEIAWGTEKKPAPPEQAIGLLIAAGKSSRGAKP